VTRPSLIAKLNATRPFAEVDLDMITVPPNRLRPLQPEKVDQIAESITQQDLIHPIKLRARRDRCELLAGWHRLEAVRKLGHTKIRAEVVEGLTDDQAKLIEIDENLMRAELTPAERAAHIAKRKAIYERMHPETKQGGAPGKAGGGKEAKAANLAGFAEATAKATGQSQRKVERDAKRGKDIPDVASLAGTSLDKGEELDALTKLPEAERDDIIKRAQAGEKVTARRLPGQTEFAKAMAHVAALCEFKTAPVPVTLTAQEVQKHRSNIKKAQERLDEVDAKLAALSDGVEATKH
jgi:ParB family chromosome partitioning protein